MAGVYNPSQARAGARRQLSVSSHGDLPRWARAPTECAQDAARKSGVRPRVVFGCSTPTEPVCDSQSGPGRFPGQRWAPPMPFVHPERLQAEHGATTCTHSSMEPSRWGVGCQLLVGTCGRRASGRSGGIQRTASATAAHSCRRLCIPGGAAAVRRSADMAVASALGAMVTISCGAWRATSRGLRTGGSSALLPP